MSNPLLLKQHKDLLKKGLSGNMITENANANNTAERITYSIKISYHIYDYKLTSSRCTLVGHSMLNEKKMIVDFLGTVI